MSIGNMTEGGPMTCPVCHGSGHTEEGMEAHAMTGHGRGCDCTIPECPACDGMGTVTEEQAEQLDYIEGWE